MVALRAIGLGFCFAVLVVIVAASIVAGGKGP